MNRQIFYQANESIEGELLLIRTEFPVSNMFLLVVRRSLLYLF